MRDETNLPVFEMSELDLVRQARTGDRDAFTRLYKAHAGHVYATCLRMLADPMLAEDLAQESIVKAWQMLHSFRDESPFGAWLHRIAVNTVIDHMRREKRLSLLITFTDDPGVHETNGRGLSPEHTMDIEAAISSLPIQARTILVLHDIEGYRHEEIAGMLDIVVGTSKAQLHRARHLLKERLER